MVLSVVLSRCIQLIFSESFKPRRTFSSIFEISRHHQSQPPVSRSVVLIDAVVSKTHTRLFMRLMIPEVSLATLQVVGALCEFRCIIITIMIIIMVCSTVAKSIVSLQSVKYLGSIFNHNLSHDQAAFAHI